MKNIESQKQNIGVIIQARMGSSRLPGKVMLPLLGKPVLYRMIERTKYCQNVTNIIIATTIKKEDDAIADFARKIDIDCYRGSEKNVLLRYYKAAQIFKLNIVVRVTGDCPLIDPEIIDKMLSKFKKLNTDGKSCDYLSNTIKRSFPRGLDVEIFSFQTLERIIKEADSTYFREHVTTFVRNFPAKFKIVHHVSRPDNSRYRWTLDEKDDYKLIKAVYNELYSKNHEFRYKDILSVFKKNPSLALINAHIQQKAT